MEKIENFRALIFLISAFILIFSEPQALEARSVYVRLSQAGSYTVGVTQGNMSMTDGEGKVANIGQSALIISGGDRVSIAGYSFMLPVRITGPGFLQFNGKTYRGVFLITQRGGLLNVLDVEQYLCGVLPAEVGASWPMESLRAQAIISRTYVLKQSMNRAEKGYDVVDTDADQVYKGQGVETAKTNQAVSSTAGEIVTYQNEIAFTPFHSDSGGHTANNSDVWGQDLPYLTGVPEAVSYKSPVSSWSARIPASKIASAVSRLGGADIGQVKEIQVSEVDQGGRAVKMTFVGNKGSKTVKASQFRTAVDPKLLKSTMFTPSGGAFNINNNSTPSGLVTQQNTGQKKSGSQSLQNQPDSLTFDEEQGLASMTAAGVFTTTELIDMLTNPNKQKNYYQIGLGRKTRNSQVPGTLSRPVMNKYGFSIERSGSDFVFYGRGWGHGVGLCQWGAMAMAEKGWTAEKILTHYYPGTSIRRFK